MLSFNLNRAIQPADIHDVGYDRRDFAAVQKAQIWNNSKPRRLRPASWDFAWDRRFT